jgi:ribosomal protein RSM22 (predicted rRNA methylase)
VNLPGNLNVALARFLDETGRGGLSEASAALSQAYKAGNTSRAVDLAAYVVTRVPATFAANASVMAALAEAWPDFVPLSLLDVGAGPGVASWAAVTQWPDITTVTQVEHDRKFAGLAKQLNGWSGIAALCDAEIRQTQLQNMVDATADLVIASYVLAELPLEQMAQTADRLWAAAKQALVLIEPGTPQGFQRLQVIREHMLKRGAHIVAPCTHAAACPMVRDDWCHFKVRLARSRAHMHAKGAVVPFEDEAFSYLVVSRLPVAVLGGRIMAPPGATKAGITFNLCDGQGLHRENIASRDKQTYKRAKKLRWGDRWT